LSGLVKVAVAYKKKAGHQTGLMSGSLEAWKMLDLVMQIMFSISDTNDILPNNGVWFSTMTGLAGDHICANISMVVTQACASALEMAKFLRSGHYTSDDRSLGIYLEKIGRFHHARLALLKKILYCVCTGVGFETVTLQNCISGNKFHYYEHIRLARELYGVDIRIFDTESSEKLHQTSVVIPHRNGNKRIAGKQRNMLRHFKRGLFIDKFGKSEDSPKVLEFEEDQTRSFLALGRYKFNMLVFDYSKQGWTFQADITEFYFHPYMTMKQLASTIQDIQSDYGCIDNARYQFYLMEQISCKEDKEEDWSIYCSQHYNATQYVPGATSPDIISTWSIVTAELNGKGGVIMHCLVLAIIYVECELSDGKFNSFHLVVNPLKFSDEVGVLPYDYVEHSFDSEGHLEMLTISCKDDVIDGALGIPVLTGTGSNFDTKVNIRDSVQRQWIVVAKSRYSFPREHLSTPSMYNDQYPTSFPTSAVLDDLIYANSMQRTPDVTSDGILDDYSIHSQCSSSSDASV
jgi:hypothetical protein